MTSGQRSWLAALASSLGVACYAGGPSAAVGDDASSATDDAGADADADAMEDAGADTAPVSPCNDAVAGEGGTTWKDLYRDYFGPSGAASCTARSNCHGAADQTGALNSGFVCGATQDSCFAGLIAAGSIVPEGGTANPEQTTLYAALRKAPPNRGGAMPRNSAFAFCPEDLVRIAAWIAAGCRND